MWQLSCIRASTRVERRIGEYVAIYLTFLIGEYIKRVGCYYIRLIVRKEVSDEANEMTIYI